MADVTHPPATGVSAGAAGWEESLTGLAERLFDGLLEAVPDAVVIVDRNGIIIQINRQAENLFGFRRDELIGGMVEVLMPERFRGSHVVQRDVYSADPQPRAMDRQRELIGLRKDGHEFPIDVLLSPLPTSAGILVASSIRDITPHRQLENELRERTRDLEEADLQKDHFLAAVAHELRSPLAVLTQVAHILRSPQAGEAGQNSALGALERQTSVMARLVEDLLDLSRVRRGKVSLREEKIDLRTVVLAAVEICHPLFVDRKHQLVVAQPPDPVWIVGDAVRLAQVVSNLLNNAAKYTPAGCHICLTVIGESPVAAIRVRDDGEGIPQALLSRVFDLFAQVGSPREQAGGLGIGLALVRRLVEMHGGTVEAFSEGPAKGSEFVVLLPLLSMEPD
ncbi:hypothetical protein BH11PSE14_BH11PSE14_13930 [soil metagenome]